MMMMIIINILTITYQKPLVHRVSLAWAVSVSVTVLTRQKAVLSTVEAVRLGVLLATLGRIVRQVS